MYSLFYFSSSEEKEHALKHSSDFSLSPLAHHSRTHTHDILHRHKHANFLYLYVYEMMINETNFYITFMWTWNSLEFSHISQTPDCETHETQKQKRKKTTNEQKQFDNCLYLWYGTVAARKKDFNSFFVWVLPTQKENCLKQKKCKIISNGKVFFFPFVFRFFSLHINWVHFHVRLNNVWLSCHSVNVQMRMWIAKVREAIQLYIKISAVRTHSPARTHARKISLIFHTKLNINSS